MFIIISTLLITFQIHSSSMEKVCYQEKFDEVAGKNMEKFGMKLADAVADAKEKFDMQGKNIHYLKRDLNWLLISTTF